MVIIDRGRVRGGVYSRRGGRFLEGVEVAVGGDPGVGIRRLLDIPVRIVGLAPASPGGDDPSLLHKGVESRVIRPYMVITGEYDPALSPTKKKPPCLREPPWTIRVRTRRLSALEK